MTIKAINLSPGDYLKLPNHRKFRQASKVFFLKYNKGEGMRFVSREDEPDQIMVTLKNCRQISFNPNDEVVFEPYSKNIENISFDW